MWHFLQAWVCSLSQNYYGCKALENLKMNSLLLSEAYPLWELAEKSKDSLHEKLALKALQDPDVVVPCRKSSQSWEVDRWILQKADSQEDG